jgi:hypothetical protein
MRQDVCVWCHQKIQIPDGNQNTTYTCSQGCRDAEYLFRLLFSDEAINRREHYKYLTRGDDDE